MKDVIKIKTVILMVILLAVQYSNAQSGVRFHSDQAMEGYTLYGSGNRAVLIDNCGHLVHEWTEVSAQYHPKLLPNGNIVYIEYFSRDIVERNWNNNIVNGFSFNGDIEPNYEIIVKPNGNYLLIARNRIDIFDFEDLGYNIGNPSTGNGKGFPTEYDMIIEVDRLSGAIVWEWHIIDHMIQERDASLANYGVVADHPELLNMDAIATYDWNEPESFMINGFDYNPDLDQIVLSVRKMSEVVIIDHSTTKEEAAGHTGGNSGKGGDILYRWGNPANYGRGSSQDRYLFFQHNPNWIKYGQNAGKLIMYNNGLTRFTFPSINDYSSVPIIDPGVDENGQYFLPTTKPYGPNTPELEFSKITTGNDFFSGYTSAGKLLPNGNVMVTVGGDDRVFEMLQDGTVVWEYGLHNSNLTFRAEKYALDYPAFVGRDLSPGDVLESPPSTVDCTLVDVVDTYFDNSKVWIADNQLRLTTDITEKLTLKMYSVNGTLMMERSVVDNQYFDISDFSVGVYFVNVKGNESKNSITFKVIR